MSGRHVTFQFTTSPKESSKVRRSREPAYDSGLGSSSSDQHSMGGRPDRRSTEDYDSQLYNVGALQEALGQANQEVERLNKKCTELDTELSKTHRVARDAERLYREAYERSEKLEKLNRDLKEEKDVQAEKIKNLKAAYDEARDECSDYRMKYLNLLEPVSSTMRGGSGEPSSKDNKESRDRAKRHPDQKDDKTRSSSHHRHHRRSSSISVHTGGRSSSKKPYIEKMPEAPGNYIATAANSPTVSRMEPALYSSIPRTSQPTTSPLYPTTHDISTGNYVRYPLRDHRNEQRGRRSS
ncbi:hypothetical protein AAE478_005688 [Parahypoxylon ruwenzoriense]